MFYQINCSSHESNYFKMSSWKILKWYFPSLMSSLLENVGNSLVYSIKGDTRIILNLTWYFIRWPVAQVNLIISKWTLINIPEILFFSDVIPLRECCKHISILPSITGDKEYYKLPQFNFTWFYQMNWSSHQSNYLRMSSWKILSDTFLLLYYPTRKYC